MPSKILPISAAIPTRNRPGPLRATLESLAEQSAQPAEVVVVDASDGPDTEHQCSLPPAGLRAEVRWFRAQDRGAGVQRNEAITRVRYPFVAFMDDDILFEPECVSRAWAAIQSDPQIGGVSATITNQQYHPPGRVTQVLFRVLTGRWQASYAGRVIGPAVNQLPADHPALPDVVPTEWLNTTCTLYRREALPDPPFPAHFTGYSMCEDLTLSLTVGRGWKLANARTARIFHDSQPGDHKHDPAKLAEMEIVNRHYVMTQVLGRGSLPDYLRLGLWEAYVVAASARGGVRRLAGELVGKFRGTVRLLGEGF